MTIVDIANKIKKSGGTLYLVGGALRDRLLGRDTNDEDYCITGITADIFIKMFPEAKIRGKSFEVFSLMGKEFAMARTETKNGVGHKEFNIITNENITIEEDLSRRDITINSIAENVLTKEIIDPFNGKKDLKDKIIRATTPAFKEDPLRVYRVARFATQLEFKVEKKTLKMMNEVKNELNILSKERVFEEFKKALNSRNPSIFFEILRKANVLDVHFEEIYNLIGALQPEQYHPEGDAYVHSIMVLDYASQETTDLAIRFSALVHDLGKGVTPKEEYPHHYNHEINGVELVEKLGNRIGVPTLWIKCGQIACREHMRGGIFYKMKPSKKADFIERVNKSNLGLNGLQIIVNADKLSSRNTNAQDINFATIGNQCLNTINGEYIFSKYKKLQGVKFGEKLREERIKWIQNN